MRTTYGNQSAWFAAACISVSPKGCQIQVNPLDFVYSYGEPWGTGLMLAFDSTHVQKSLGV